MIAGDDDNDNHNNGHPLLAQSAFLPKNHYPASGSHENLLPGCTDLIALESHQHLDTLQWRRTIMMMIPDSCNLRLIN